jgi:hypothetical protein
MANGVAVHSRNSDRHYTKGVAFKRKGGIAQRRAQGEASLRSPVNKESAAQHRHTAQKKR